MSTRQIETALLEVGCRLIMINRDHVRGFHPAFGWICVDPVRADAWRVRGACIDAEIASMTTLISHVTDVFTHLAGKRRTV